MVTDEFLRSIRNIQDFFAETGFISQVQTFADIASNAKSGSQPNWREALTARFEEIDNLIISFEQKHNIVLEENAAAKLSPLIGTIADYKSVINGFFNDIITADSEVRGYAANLESARAQLEQLSQSLTVLGIETPPAPDNPELDVATFEFKHATDINNLKSLGKAASELDKHIRALSKLDSKNLPSDVEIITLSKSSPLVVTAWVTGQVAKVLNKIVSDALDNAKKVQELRSMEEDIKSKKLDNDNKEIQNSLREVRADFEKKIIENITIDLVGNQPDETRNGVRNEIHKGVKDAVEYFVVQTSKGLEVRVLPSHSEITDPEKGKELLHKYRDTLRELESLRKFLPESFDEPDGDGSTSLKPKKKQ